MIYKFGFIKGICLIWVLYKSFVFAVEHLYGMNKVSAGDTVLLWPKYESSYNLSMILKMDKMNPNTMKDYLIQNCLKRFRKLRAKLVFKFLCWWWKDIPIEEAAQRIKIIEDPNLIFRKDSELNEYAMNFLEEKFDLENEIPFKILIIKNDLNKEDLRNIVIIKCDHSMGDGLSFSLLASGTATNFSQSLYPPIFSKKLPFFWHMYMNLLIPLNLLKIAYNYFIKVNDMPNPLKLTNGKKLSGKSVISLTKQIDFQKVSQINKKLGITFNSFMTAILISALKKYFKNEFNYESKRINIYSPTARETIPKKKEDIRITNNTSGFGAQVDFLSDPLTEYHSVVKEYTANIQDFSLNYCQKLVQDWCFYFLPFYLSKIISMYIFRCFDIVFSNVPGSKELLNYGESTAIDMYPMLTTGFKPTFNILYSYNGKFRLMTSLDKGLGLNPEIFTKYLEMEIDSIISKQKEGS